MIINADSELTYINFIVFYIFQNIDVVLYAVYPYLVEFEKFMCVVDGIDALDLAGKTQPKGRSNEYFTYYISTVLKYCKYIIYIIIVYIFNDSP